mmetsp:Transcript_55461/g.132184  ORF Transcript_55461/g.132184 Transcript_55461/m.132184 type:complete len:275 (-) Transcript_55461:3085-3909(-)
MGSRSPLGGSRGARGDAEQGVDVQDVRAREGAHRFAHHRQGPGRGPAADGAQRNAQGGGGSGTRGAPGGTEGAQARGRPCRRRCCGGACGGQGRARETRRGLARHARLPAGGTTSEDGCSSPQGRSGTARGGRGARCRHPASLSGAGGLRVEPDSVAQGRLRLPRGRQGRIRGKPARRGGRRRGGAARGGAARAGGARRCRPGSGDGGSKAGRGAPPGARGVPREDPANPRREAGRDGRRSDGGKRGEGRTRDAAPRINRRGEQELEPPDGGAS